jgi:hypothetical protein
MQFGIRRLLIAVTVVAVACALYIAALNCYYSERNLTTSVLAQIKGISNIKLISYIDIIEEIKGCSFSVDGQPDSMITVGGLGDYEDQGSFTVSKIGKWRFRIFGQRHMGSFLESTGEPIESNYWSGHLGLGPASPCRDLIPFEFNTLQDVVEHYAEFVDLLESWPREAKPGSVKLEDGTTQFFYVIEEGK